MNGRGGRNPWWGGAEKIFTLKHAHMQAKKTLGNVEVYKKGGGGSVERQLQLHAFSSPLTMTADSLGVQRLKTPEPSNMVCERTLRASKPHIKVLNQPWGWVGRGGG